MKLQHLAFENTVFAQKMIKTHPQCLRPQKYQVGFCSKRILYYHPHIESFLRKSAHEILYKQWQNMHKLKDILTYAILTTHQTKQVALSFLLKSSGSLHNKKTPNKNHRPIISIFDDDSGNTPLNKHRSI